MKKVNYTMKKMKEHVEGLSLEQITGYDFAEGHTEHAVKYIDDDGKCYITMNADLFNELFGWSVELVAMFQMTNSDAAMKNFTLRQRAFAQYFAAILGEKAVREAHAIYCMRPMWDKRKKGR